MHEICKCIFVNNAFTHFINYAPKMSYPTWAYVLPWSGLPWSALVCPGLPWSGLVCPGLPWSALVYPGLPWSALVCPGLPWSPSVSTTSPNPSPEASNRVILVRRTFLYTLELPRLSLLKVAAGAGANNSSPGNKAHVNSRTQELP
jgi:hypothetical protein